MPNVLRHIKPRRILDVGGVFLFLLVINMRMVRVVAAMLGMGAIFTEPVRSNGCDWESVLWRQPQANKSKPNKLSQKKRRLNARRLGKFK